MFIFRLFLWSLRMCFWGMLLLFLLPSSPQQKEAIYTAAEQTVSDVSGFCDRNPQACETARSAFQTLVEKIRIGAEMVEDMLRDGGQSKSDDRLSAHDDATASVPPPSQSTLRSDDLRPEWRAPAGLAAR